MTGKRVGVLGSTVAIVAVGTVITAAFSHTLFERTPAMARGSERPSHPAANYLSTAIQHAVASHPALHRPAIGDQPRAIHHTARPIVHPRSPAAPATLRQIGGLEPAMRSLPIGSWLNAARVTIAAPLSSPMTSAPLQLQIELRRAGQPFTGRVTASSAPVDYSGTAVPAQVTLTGLLNGVAYHWRARVHDLRGPSSAWVDSGPVAFRVYLDHPAAPALSLDTPMQPGGWVASRRLTLHWSPPADGSGIRGYSYTLARNPQYQPLLHWRTWLTGVTVHARGQGLWYFSVRALNYAHSWGPPASLAIYIDTTVPRLRILTAPVGTINPRRAHPLLRLGLTAWSRLAVAIVNGRGTVVHSITTGFSGPGSVLALNWDGRDGRGHAVPNGAYTVRITAVGRSGITWQTTRPLDIEDMPPAFVSYGQTQTGTYNLYNNPIDGPEQITATLDTPSRVTIQAIRAVHGEQVMRTWTWSHVAAGQVITATWDGYLSKDVPMVGGLYLFRAVAVDAAGNRTVQGLGWVVLDRRRIVVSLAKQQLWAMDGNHVLLSVLVTTGGPELPTPTGDFQILDRESPFTFHSPFPPSSPFWYADSPVNFALLFDWGGYFIHDAPWRSFYGPGSNVIDAPGTNTGGSHGCVNVPYTQMAWLYTWATLNTPVQVRQDFTPLTKG